MTAWVDRHVPELAPEWFGHYPMRRTRNGVEFNLGRGNKGILAAQGVHYWDGEWRPVDHQPIPDRSGGFGFPHKRPFHIHAGGFITDAGVTSGLRSMGVMRHGRYFPVWKATTYGVGEGKMFQCLGPYEVVTNIAGCQKQSIVLPEMPCLDGEDLVLDYYARNLAPPDQCRARPFAKDAFGVEVDMKKWRTPWGKQESIPLGTLASLRFPVTLDPEICTPGDGWYIVGQSAVYLTAHSVRTLRINVREQATGQARTILGGIVAVARNPVRLDTAGFSGSILSVDIKTSCSVPLGVGAYPFNDDLHFVRYDWRAFEPVDFADTQTMFTDTRDAPLGGIYETVLGLRGLGCGLDANCVYGNWRTLEAADAAFLDAQGLGNSLYWSQRSKEDFLVVAPPAVPVGWIDAQKSAPHAGPGYQYCPMCLRINAGGYTWLVGG